MLDDLDHDDAAEAAGLETAQVFDGEPLFDVESTSAGARHELKVRFDAVYGNAELGQKLHELAAAEADVDDRLAVDELLGEFGVPGAQVVAATSEECGELILAVPRVE